ncbi:MAG: histidine phosphatase family protein [Pyrinomonadaceae bacterium]
MKRLYLLRHAESDWGDSAVDDFDRRLTDRGVRTVLFMGALMDGRGLSPDVIVSSPAKRAMQTAEMVLDASGFDRSIDYDERIYEAGVSTLLNVITGLPDEDGSALIVGHNPGMEGIIHSLTGAVQPMPTGAIAVISLDVARWAATADRSGTLDFVIRPEEEMKKAEEDDLRRPLKA